jgi:hypothetical protein
MIMEKKSEIASCPSTEALAVSPERDAQSPKLTREQLQQKLECAQASLDSVVREIVMLDPNCREAMALVARSAGRYIGSDGDNDLWAAFAMALKDDESAARELKDLVSIAPAEEEYTLAFAAGFGMIAGMMYAGLTGITLPLS